MLAPQYQRQGSDEQKACYRTGYCQTLVAYEPTDRMEGIPASQSPFLMPDKSFLYPVFTATPPLPVCFPTITTLLILFILLKNARNAGIWWGNWVWKI